MQVPAAQTLSSAPHGIDFRMAGRIVRVLARIACAGKNYAVFYDYGAYGNFIARGASARLRESAAHKALVRRHAAAASASQ